MPSLSRRVVRAFIYSTEAEPCVLLLHKVDPTNGDQCWIIPGGGVGDTDAGPEDDVAALQRELGEEVGLREPIESSAVPVWSGEESFDWNGEHHRRDGHAFVVRVRRFEAVVESKPTTLGARWWPVSEIRGAVQGGQERFAPADAFQSMFDGTEGSEAHS